MSNLLNSIGAWSATEGGFEIGTPLSVIGVVWWAAYKVLGAPADGRPLSELELIVLLGACAGLTGWAVARTTYVMGKRGKLAMLGPSVAAALLCTYMAGSGAQNKFESWCQEEFAGTIVVLEPYELTDLPKRPACQNLAVAGSAYLPGTLVMPAWSGSPGPLLWLWIALIGGLGGIGFRDVRLRNTKVPNRLWDMLRLSPSQGPSSSIGGVSDDGVQACTNATLWGEICGQLYPAAKEFEPGEWCARCQQSYTKCERTVTFNVATLFTADIDVLNGLERMDTVAWDRGEPMPPDARVSGVERWVTLGTVTFPDVITVSQALALLLAKVESMVDQDDERAVEAAKLAAERASRVSSWIWFGNQAHRLTYSRPTSRVLLATGSRRLRDIVGSVSEDLTLQLDIGLLPVEVRMGYHRTFLDGMRMDVWQNSKTDYWVPVAPPEPTADPGSWVPRIEGAALQAWLSFERKSGAGVRGVSNPLPYLPHDPAVDVKRDEEGRPILDGVPEVEPEGVLDLIRVEVRPHQNDVPVVRSPGDSIAEWDWMEWRQIELLRQHPLVFVESEEVR